MNKSPQYNQQSKSEAEERCIYQNMENGCLSLYIWKKIAGSIPEKIASNNIQK